MPDEERIEQLELEIKVLRANNKGLKDKIDEQSKEIEELKEENQIYRKQLNSAFANGFIHKNKIKAKIEEIDIEIQCCEYADDDTEEYKQDIEKEKRRLLRDKAVLQSLLEKE